MSKGVIYMILSSLAFSLQNVIVKELSYTMSTGEISFFRGFLSALLILALMKAQHIHFSKYDRPTLWFRGVVGGAGMICIFYALRGMPLADVSILSQLSAFFVMIFAAVFLKEGGIFRRSTYIPYSCWLRLCLPLWLIRRSAS